MEQDKYYEWLSRKFTATAGRKAAVVTNVQLAVCIRRHNQKLKVQ